MNWRQVVLGYVGVILMPIAGIVFGVMCYRKGRVRNGMAILILNALAILGYILMQLENQG